MVYEMYGLILALHHDARFLRMPGSVDRARAGFERLIENYQNPQEALQRSLIASPQSFNHTFVRRKPWVSTSRQSGICSSCCTNSSTSPTN